MVYFNNKSLHHKEIELREEKEKLEIFEDHLKKRRGLFEIKTNVILLIIKCFSFILANRF